MRCGKCGGVNFTVAMGTVTCTHCGEEVSNEVAAAIREGLKPGEGEDGSA